MDHNRNEFKEPQMYSFFSKLLFKNKFLAHREHSRSKPCGFCSEDPLLNYKLSYKTLEKKYFEAFNFYFAKPVNEILANVSSPHVILFKDYLYFDDDSNEYLKRYYRNDEITPRVKALTEFYENSYKPTRPNLSIIDANKIINKRNQKMNKLFLARNNQENFAEANKDNKNNDFFDIQQPINKEIAMEPELFDNENLILEHMLTSNFEKDEENDESNLPMRYKYQEEQKDNEILRYIEPKEDPKQKISYDSSMHDIYNPEFSENNEIIKDFEQIMKPTKISAENKPLSLNKIKTRTVFKQQSTPKQNYEILLEEIITKQKQKIGENSDFMLSSFKMNNNILKDFSENRISDMSELQNLHEMIRNSQKLSTQSSNQKQNPLKKEKNLVMEMPHLKKKENVSSQLTQESTKRTTGNTTNASQNALKNPENLKNKKIHISHNTLFSQINKFYNNKTGNVDQIFELIKKMQKDEEKNKVLNLPSDSSKVMPVLNKQNPMRNCSTKSNKDILANPTNKFIGSQTDRIPDKSHEQLLFIKPKKNINKLNLNLLNPKEKTPKETTGKMQRTPNSSRHSHKKTVENQRKNSTKKPQDLQRNAKNKPNKISFRSLNSNIYSTLRNRSNISSKSHLDTQRSSDVLVFKSQDQILNKEKTNLATIQHKSQLENLEENESSYGFWTSRSNKANIEELKKRNKSPDIMGKRCWEPLKGNRDDYYNYGLKEHDNYKCKAKTDRYVNEKEINQFIQMAYEKPQLMKIKTGGDMNKRNKKKNEKKNSGKKNFHLNLNHNSQKN